MASVTSLRQAWPALLQSPLPEVSSAGARDGSSAGLTRVCMRKRRGSGDPPGLQNRRLASSMSMVRSTRTRFRHLLSATCMLGAHHYWVLSSVAVACWLHSSSKALIAAVASAETDFT